MATKSRAGEVAVITGGAGGIGMAAAELWIAAGGSVVAADLNDEEGQAFATKHKGRVV
jgi:NAD(P)-dependent dehydrogenase (short-subunit alcohol dehydrogenase family)